MKKILNQNLINLIEYYSLINNNITWSNTPIIRNSNNLSTTLTFHGTKPQKLEELKKNILY